MGLVGRLVEGQLPQQGALVIEDAQATQAFDPLTGDQVMVEEHHFRQQRVFAVRNDLVPSLAPDGDLRRTEQAEVARVVVAADPPVPGVVVDVILVFTTALGENRPRAGGIVCVDESDLAAKRVFAADEQETPGGGLSQPEMEGFVGLLVDEDVFGRIAPPAVAEHPVRPQGLRILARVEEVLAVLRPDQVSPRAFDSDRQVHARLQIPDPDGVETTAHVIDRVGQPAFTGVKRPPRHLAEALSLGQDIHVQDDLLGGIGSGTAAVDRVVQAFLRPGVVPVLAHAYRRAGVGLGDPLLDLGHQTLAQGGQMRDPGLAEGVLRLQIGQHIGVLPLVQPEPIVDADVAVDFQSMGAARGAGCLQGLLRSREWGRGWNERPGTLTPLLAQGHARANGARD